jgi:hypothetical protein
MKKTILLPTIILCTVVLVNTAYGQKTDSLKTLQQTKYLAKELAITEKTAQQVATIMDDYKAAANLLVNDKTITQQQLKEKFDILIDEKNSKLEKILTEPQLQKMIPNSERKNKTTKL